MISLLDKLRDKALSCPGSPGVYLMKNKEGTVIYVGKSRKLCQRVSSYFTGVHTGKTARMVSNVSDFDYIVCDSEIEALSLENTLIKKFAPRYNIKLKDAKSYPYILVTEEAYPKIRVTRERKGAGKYFGPYSGTKEAYANVDTVNRIFRLPPCKRALPEAIGPERPCLYRQMRRCMAPCTGEVTESEYREAVKAACDVLSGNVRETAERMKAEMTALAEEERFESAARLRDALTALSKLGETQKVLCDESVSVDVWGMTAEETCGALAVLSIRGGRLNRKNEYTFSAREILDGETAVGFIASYYENGGDIPQKLLLAFPGEEESRKTLEETLSAKRGKKTPVLRPLRGENKALCDMAEKNALSAAEKYRENAVREEKTLLTLAKLLSLEVLPETIEMYDISNIGEEYVTAGMIVWQDGKLRKQRYRTFKIRSVTRDDYGAMREALRRRLAHRDEADFALPDLILLDGGAAHVRVGREVLAEAGVDLPL
ncbi:MAG: excinuclease ABC subunit UvrC, partial [Clostridia bacterium]|nr:excinuclease ABC subunit UvrC [Clostridia bacterium]